LVDRFGYRIIYDSNSQLEAKLDFVIRQGNWCWCPARSDDLVAIQSKLPEVPIGEVDKPVWIIARSGSYVCSDTWNHLRRKKDEVSWWPLVWHSFSIPTQAFILWLAVLNRLTTGDRLIAWGFQGDSNCTFCRGEIQSQNHMFFLRGFSSRI